MPARRGCLLAAPVGPVTNRDRRPFAGQRAELAGVACFGHHMPDVTTLDAVREVIRAEHGCRRNDHHPELHRGQHHLPKRRDVAQHEQQPVTPPGPQVTQPVRDLA
jgi:hypothetical protein